MGDVVAVANVGQAQAREAAEALVQGEQVGQNLARVLEVGEGVDDRHAGMLRQADHVGVQEDARDDGVGVAAEDTRGVDHALTLAEPDFGRRQVDGVAAELQHADLERHAGAQ